MIRRNSSKYTTNRESLVQNSFTGMRGIDYSKAPTSPDTVYNMCNLDVDYDGGLVLRKPLVYNRSNVSTYTTTIFNGSRLDINGSNILIDYDTRVQNNNTYTYDRYGSKVYYGNDTFVYHNLKNARCVNTATSTLIYNVEIEIKAKHINNNDLEPMIQNRILKLYKEDNTYFIQLLNSEMNHIEDSDVPLDYNLMLENPLAIRDNYEAPLLSIPGILAYTTDTEIVNDTTIAGFNDYSLEEVPDGSWKLTLTLKVSKSDNVYAILFKGSINGTDLKRYLFHDVTKDEDDFEFWSMVQFINRNTYLVDGDFIYTKLSPNATLRIEDITEGAWELVSALDFSETNSILCLKAFLNIPYSIDAGTYILDWEYSSDGVSWLPVKFDRNVLQHRKIIDVAIKEIHTDELDNKTLTWRAQNSFVLNIPEYGSSVPTAYERPDCLLCTVKDILKNATYRCSIYRVISKADYISNKGDTTDMPENVDYIRDMLVSSKTYSFIDNETQYVEEDFEKPSKGNFLYYKKAIYSYDKAFGNNIYVSDTDSVKFGVSNIIDLDTYNDSYVTSIVPWRDYLIASTDKTLHLITRQDVGATTKTISTYIGIPERDSRTCVAILNGILFKSGNKIYTVYPNPSSGSETIFNISEISKSISNVLDNIDYNEKHNPFAFTNAEAYYLFIPSTDFTLCVKYDFTRKIWTTYKYPVVFVNYSMLDISDVRLYAVSGHYISEFYFEKTSDDLNMLDGTQGDVISLTKVEPIEFYVDSGQKTDNISLTKQFVETKIIVATLDSRDSFKINVNLAIEGDTIVKHIDLNTDGALLRDSTEQILTLGTSTSLTKDEDTFNTMRQMVLRYSGKGKTIRHILSGESLYKFKIYETFYRFKILNVKQ